MTHVHQLMPAHEITLVLLYDQDTGPCISCHGLTVMYVAAITNPTEPFEE